MLLGNRQPPPQPFTLDHIASEGDVIWGLCPIVTELDEDSVMRIEVFNVKAVQQGDLHSKCSSSGSFDVVTASVVLELGFGSIGVLIEIYFMAVASDGQSQMFEGIHAVRNRDCPMRAR